MKRINSFLITYFSTNLALILLLSDDPFSDIVLRGLVLGEMVVPCKYALANLTLKLAGALVQFAVLDQVVAPVEVFGADVALERLVGRVAHLVAAQVVAARKLLAAVWARVDLEAVVLLDGVLLQETHLGEDLLAFGARELAVFYNFFIQTLTGFLGSFLVSFRRLKCDCKDMFQDFITQLQE